MEAEYAGYRTWRGIVPEPQLSSEMRELLKNPAVRYYTDVAYVAYVLPPSSASSPRGYRKLADEEEGIS